MQSFCRTGLVAMATVAFLAAADAPYMGKWKLNLAKSRLTGETLSIEKTPSGSMKYVTAEVSYDFKTDGKEYPTPRGATVTWKEESPNTWTVMNRRNGQVTATFHLLVKGDTLMVIAERKTPDAGIIKDSSKFTRESGGPGIVGKWKSTEVKAAAASMELAPNGSDGLTLKDLDFGVDCAAKFDGKDYPLTGPQAPSKTTLSFKKTGANSFEMTEKIEGKPVYVDSFSVSPDGKTLTDDGNREGTHPSRLRSRVVWCRR